MEETEQEERSAKKKQRKQQHRKKHSETQPWKSEITNWPTSSRFYVGETLRSGDIE